MLRKWLYVMATVQEPIEDPGAVSFRHAIVEAEDEDDAYDVGYQQLGSPQAGSRETMNDYVVEL